MGFGRWVVLDLRNAAPSQERVSATLMGSFAFHRVGFEKCSAIVPGDSFRHRDAVEFE